MGDLLADLGIQWQALLVNIVGFVILVYLLKRFAFGKIGRFMDERADGIESDIEHARSDREAAADELAALEDQLDETRGHFQAEMAEKTRLGKQAIAEMHAEARSQREAMLKQGQDELERSRETMIADVKRQAADMAVEIADKALRDSLDDQRQAGLVDAFIEDVNRIAASSSEGSSA